MILNAFEVLARGLALLHIGYRNGVEMPTKIEDFKSHYGSTPSVLAKLWNDLQSTNVEEAKIDGEDVTDIGFRSFMIANYFLCNYPKSSKATGQAFKLKKHVGYGAELWNWIEKIAAMKDVTIFWPEELNDPQGAKIIVIVDGKDQKRWEVQHPYYNKDKKYYSHKSNSAALKWEIGLAVHSQRMVHIGGPFRGGLHDSSIYNGELEAIDYDLREALGMEGEYIPLEKKIPEGKFGIADSAYAGFRKLLQYSGRDSAELANFKTRGKLRLEAINGRFCKFKCIGDTFRHSVPKQKSAFDAVAVLVQYELDDTSTLFAT